MNNVFVINRIGENSNGFSSEFCGSVKKAISQVAKFARSVVKGTKNNEILVYGIEDENELVHAIVKCARYGNGVRSYPRLFGTATSKSEISEYAAPKKVEHETEYPAEVQVKKDGTVCTYEVATYHFKNGVDGETELTDCIGRFRTYKEAQAAAKSAECDEARIIFFETSKEEYEDYNDFAYCYIQWEELYVGGKLVKGSREEYIEKKEAISSSVQH